MRIGRRIIQLHGIIEWLLGNKSSIDYQAIKNQHPEASRNIAGSINPTQQPNYFKSSLPSIQSSSTKNQSN